MTSKINPSVPIELGGKERHLLLDLNAMVAFEEATGKNILSGLSAKMGASELRALLYACLRHEDEKLTLKEVGAWITTENMGEVARQITAAWTAAMPEKAEGDKREKTPLAPKPPAG
jgi:hypothetical protein